LRAVVVILIAAVVSDCQCLVPVSELAEPGRPAVRDAGGDGGAPDGGPGPLRDAGGDPDAGPEPSLDAGLPPATCADWGAECGLVPDGFGGLLNCGDCLLPGICGGDGKPNRCGLPIAPPLDAGRCDSGACAARTCAEVGATCGVLPGDCGGLLDCGPCADGGLCSGNVCLWPLSCPPGSCCALSCEARGWTCSLQGDGCGGLLDCGRCDGGLSCGGGGIWATCGRADPSPAGGCLP
jgi:hypothetical protein